MTGSINHPLRLLFMLVVVAMLGACGDAPDEQPPTFEEDVDMGTTEEPDTDPAVMADDTAGMEEAETMDQMADSQQQAQTDPAMQGGDMVAQGEQIFTGKGICYTCHGRDGTGTNLAPNLTDDTWLNIQPPVDQQKVVQLVKDGVPQPVEHPAPMMPRGGVPLSDEEVEAVSAYVMSLVGSGISIGTGE